MNDVLRSRAWLFLLWLLALCCAGCFGMSAPDRPGFDPAASAKKAIATYDTNSDGVIDEEEVKASPGMREAFANIDTDGDKQLSAAEIEARVKYYKSAPTVIVQGQTRVTYRGRPLAEAILTFEPEPFLGSEFLPCEGVTNFDGIASVKGHDSEFPGIYLGFYTVRVSKVQKGRETIPKKYNEETILGYEATDDMNMGFADIISFNLK